MQIITLPDTLARNNIGAIQVFDYSSFKGINKQQINLKQNVFSFLNRGSKKIIIDNTSLSIDNSNFLVMKSGHCLNTEILSETDNYRSILLFFSDGALFKVFEKIDVSRINLEPNKYKSVYSFKYNKFIIRFVESLLDISKLSLDRQQKLLEVKLEEIILYLIEVYGIEFLYSLMNKKDDLIQKFIHIVEANQLNDLTIKELAFLCNMSESTFKRKFEQYYSESPVKWFKNKRLEYAHYLLNYKRKKASEIYLEIGYESLSSFIQAYKSKYKSTAKQYKK